MTRVVKVCPSCGDSRPPTELVCNHVDEDGVQCGYTLLDVTPGPPPAPREPIQDGSPETLDRDNASTSDLSCPNGHRVEAGDLLCGTCGAELTQSEDAAEAQEPQLIGKWRVLQSLEARADEAEHLFVEHADTQEQALMRLYTHGIEPSTRTYPAIQKLSSPYLAKLIDFDRLDAQSFEVWDELTEPTLSDWYATQGCGDEEFVILIEQVAQALKNLQAQSLWHGEITTDTIKVCNLAPLMVQLGGLTTVKLAEFQLDLSRAHQLTRYVAPEVMVGAQSAASDWWSLGIIALEILTDGGYFEDTNDRAFLLQAVARNLSLPDSISDPNRLLLKGLLTRDPNKRWGYEQVSAWLSGDRDIPVHFEADQSDVSGSILTLGGTPHRSIKSFASSAATAEDWDEALSLAESGQLSAWLEDKGFASEDLQFLGQILDEYQLDKDVRFALILLLLNEHLPLVVRGNIQTPNEFLRAPDDAARWLAPQTISFLKELSRENWIIELADRADRVKTRADELDLRLTEDRFNLVRLATYTSNLENYWRERRSLFPDSDHPAISALLERSVLSDEDLLILICADDLLFRNIDDVLAEANKLANEVGGVPFNKTKSQEALRYSKRQIVDRVGEKVETFKRTDHETLDAWADSLRLGQRLSFAQLLILDATPYDLWKEPAHQNYLVNVLQFLQKKILSRVQRGPLVKLSIGRSATRLDLTDLGSEAEVQMLLQRLFQKNEEALVFPAGGQDEKSAARAHRLNTIRSKTLSYRRDTGVNALVLGFPLIGLEQTLESRTKTVRLAPLFLWPLNLTKQNNQFRLAYDPNRDVEINPALNRVLGDAQAEDWRKVLEPLITREVHNTRTLFNALKKLKPAITEDLMPVPAANEFEGHKDPHVISAGAVMLADFPSQAIVRDLETILSQPLHGSALSNLLRIEEVQFPDTDPDVPEIDRYEVLDADPSQQAAVYAARNGAGLRLEGPPGTGKSQTIVNTITDCLGRGETVMLVCEKQAALEVVHKRLRAEGLGDRVVRIENTVSDRMPTLRALSDQLHHVMNQSSDTLRRIGTERKNKASEIERLEASLNSYQEAVFQPSEKTGRSFRDIVASTAALDAAAAGLSLSGLRDTLGTLANERLEALTGECEGILETWFDADLSSKALNLFKTFQNDPGLQNQLDAKLQRLEEIERERRSLIAEIEPISGLPTIVEPTAFSTWLSDHERPLQQTDDQTRLRTASWRALLTSSDNGPSIADTKAMELDELIAELRGLAPTPDERGVLRKVRKADPDTLSKLAQRSSYFAAKKSFLVSINPFSPFIRMRARGRLKKLGIETQRMTAHAACTVAGKEIELVSARADFEDTCRIFRNGEASANHMADLLRQQAEALLSQLRDAISVANRIERSAWTHVFWDALNADRQSWQSAFERFRHAASLLKLYRTSSDIFEELEEWLEPSWLIERKKELENHRPLNWDFELTRHALPRLSALQIYRSAPLSDLSRNLFESLGGQRQKLSSLSSEARRNAIRAVIQREAATYWAHEARSERPVLSRTPNQIQSDTNALSNAYSSMRDLNKKNLGFVDQSRIGRMNKWSPILNGRGRNSRRLRAVFSEGKSLGLLDLRPIWLVNPDVASRIFPLEPGLFDVALFDEASQMRVENAVASLYRAKRVIISGDSKQLPPTRFFGSIVEDDDDEDIELDDLLGQDADAETASRRRAEEVLNRQHIKDCEDLLALSQGVLPERGLQIHYRSQYRELIEFSNAAFYRGSLEIPVKHPDEEIVRYRPIELHEVGGEYRQQSNPKEAAHVVDYLARLWTEHEGTPPTCGVVTFNLKQAQLIEKELEKRADIEPRFRAALERERVRKSDEEDVSFFVRNLENVQGDERDIIIFSTTFGTNPKGRFIKNFGALSQSGGERRLNVAVSRAKSKVVIVSSMPIDDISDFFGSRYPTKARDYLQAYMRYARSISMGELSAAKATLSQFEDFSKPKIYAPVEVGADALVEHIQSILQDRGYKTELRPLAGTFAIDLSIVHPETGLYCLGIELDGPQQGLLKSARARDIWRPSLLERQGMNVHRIFSASWADDPVKERTRLLQAAAQSVKGASA